MVHNKTIYTRYDKTFAHLGHDCTMEEGESELKRKYPGDSFGAKVKRCWVNSHLIHEEVCRRAASARMLIRSHEAIKNERGHQLRHYPSTIHNYSIFRRYLRKRFLFDILTTLPTHVDAFMDLRSSETRKSVLFALQLFSSLKILRIFLVYHLWQKFSKMTKINYFAHNVASLALSVLTVWLIFSCMIIYVYIITKDERNMIVYHNLTYFRAFSRSIYVGALILNTASYGINEPETDSQQALLNVEWIFAKMFQIYLLARCLELLKARTSPQTKYSQMVQQIVEFMRHKHLPVHTQRRILAYYEYHYQKCYFREPAIYGTVSGQLRQDIMLETCRKLVENVDFFQDIPMHLLVRVVNCLKSEIYLTNDMIIKAQTIGNCMFFIASGTVAVYTASGKEVCHLEDGAHFGEVALMNKDCLRVASVFAVESCQVYRFDRKDFVKAVHPYPDLLEKIQKVADHRVDETRLLEIHHKEKLQEEAIAKERDNPTRLSRLNSIFR